MFRTVWKFVVHPEFIDEFIRHYEADGTWSHLFRTDPAYLGTELYRDGNAFVTIDSWRDEVSYRTFREQHRQKYEALDLATEGLTISEEHIAETRG